MNENSTNLKSINKKIDNEREITKVRGKLIPVTCYGCSIFCDDCFLEVDEFNKIIKTINLCFKGNDFFNSIYDEHRFLCPIEKQMGLMMNLSMKEAIEKLQAEINGTNFIAIYGLGVLSYNDQISVLKYIKKLINNGKRVLLKNFSNLIYFCAKNSLNLTTIGQAINNGDTFIYWSTDPTHSHPKLSSKILFSRGRFRSTGKEIKKLILIESKESDLTHLADIHLNINDSDIEEFLNRLKILLTGNSLDLDLLKKFNIDELTTKNLKNYLNSTEYGVLITTIDFEKKDALEKFKLIQKFQQILNLNIRGRFTVLPISNIPNELGLCHALLSIFNLNEIKQLLDDSSFNNNNSLGLVFGGNYLRDEFINKKFEFNEPNKILFDNFPSNYDRQFKIKIPYLIPSIEYKDSAFRLDGLYIKFKDLNDFYKISEKNKEIWSISKIFENLK